LKRLSKRGLQSVAPFSDFKVGAAVRTESGKVYTGCNVESASYGLTVCAERVAIWKALSEGERHFTELAVVADTDTLTPPCGTCRQIIWEFARDAKIVFANLDGRGPGVQYRRFVAGAFDARFLKKSNHLAYLWTNMRLLIPFLLIAMLASPLSNVAAQTRRTVDLLDPWRHRCHDGRHARVIDDGGTCRYRRRIVCRWPREEINAGSRRGRRFRALGSDHAGVDHRPHACADGAVSRAG
jgi:cytidine deaminase